MATAIHQISQIIGWRRCLAIAVALVVVIGCESTQPTESLSTIHSHYRAGQFEKAYYAASRLESTAGGVDRDHAKYLAGMSAYRMDRFDEARRRLIALTDHPDPQISGPAAATVGLIYEAELDPARARTYFLQATGKLTGEDQAQVYYHLGLTEQKLGLEHSARSHLSLALSNSNSRSFKQAVQARMSNTGWTVQLGAFSSLDNAQRQAETLRSSVVRVGIEAPVVLPYATETGQTQYRVQAGRFSSWQSAVDARQRLGLTEAVVVSLDDQ